MKKISLFFIALLSCTLIHAGGIVTNVNESAMYTRMQARDAIIDIDAVFYNPAGLSFLDKDGFYFSLNNQTVSQTRTITNDYSFMNQSEFTGEVSVPFYPGVFIAYKKGKISGSFGFCPVGGGGTASYPSGLPSFEMPISDLVPKLQSSLFPLDTTIAFLSGTDPGYRNIAGYQYNVEFKGSSIFLGYQGNVSYAITEKLSVALGARYVSAKNTYKGSITNIVIDAPSQYGGTQAAGDYIRLVAQTPGLDPATIGSLTVTATVLDASTADKLVDVEQTGVGFTPLISLDYKVSDKLNVALKYEMATKLELETHIIDGKNGNGLYKEGDKIRSDMPAYLMTGLTVKPIAKLLVSTAYIIISIKMPIMAAQQRFMLHRKMAWLPNLLKTKMY